MKMQIPNLNFFLIIIRINGILSYERKVKMDYCQESSLKWNQEAPEEVWLIQDFCAWMESNILSTIILTKASRISARNSRYLSGPLLQNESWLLLKTNISQLVSESITIITRLPGLGRSPGERRGYPLQYSWTSLVAQTIKNLPAVWETCIGSPGAGTAPGEGNGYPLQYSCHKE